MLKENAIDIPDIVNNPAEIASGTGYEIVTESSILRVIRGITKKLNMKNRAKTNGKYSVQSDKLKDIKKTSKAA